VGVDPVRSSGRRCPVWSVAFDPAVDGPDDGEGERGSTPSMTSSVSASLMVTHFWLIAMSGAPSELTE
jgi:hypothetical protein